jgi:tetratricopeptide (TPR) repeat protein/TolB-like protein
MTSTVVPSQEENIILNGIPAPEIRSQLELVLRSRAFLQSHRIRRFLQFVVEESLLGQPHRLKEYMIGLEVFDRRDAFDPRVDSIVRVEARRLRYKLEEYYRTEGREDPIRIVLRKGSYVPIFELGSAGAYATGVAPRRAIEIAPFALLHATSQTEPMAEEIQRRVAHFLIKEGCFQVIAKPHAVSGAAPAAGNGNGNGHSSSVRTDYMVEGSIEFVGDHFHLLLQLLQCSGRSYVWSEATDCPVGDLASVDHLAQALVRGLMAPPGDSIAVRRHAGHKQSRDSYLQGRFFWKLATPDSIRESAACFTNAVEHDSGYAAAWAALAEALLVSSLFGFETTGANAGKMREAARKAASLSSSLPEGHVALGSVLSLLDWDWAAGEQELEKSIQLDGHDPVSHVAYGIQLACRGALDAALREVERALELDPASLLPNFILGWLHGVSRRFEESIAQHLLVARLAPDYGLPHLGLGLAYAGKGMFADAIAHFTNASQMKCRSLLGGEIGYCYAMSGRHDEARREIAALNAHSDSHDVSPVSFAAIYAGLGDQEKALGHLERAVEVRDTSLPVQLLSPEFDSLRTEPRFHALRHKMGLPEN